MINKLLNKFNNLSIKLKFIIGLTSGFIIAVPLISVVFINQSGNLLEKALEDKAQLINRNFSIVSKNAIEESSFTFLQLLIQEVPAKDKELELLVVTDRNGVIMATSDDEKYQIFSQVTDKKILDMFKQKKEIVELDSGSSLLRSVRPIYGAVAEEEGDGGEPSAVNEPKTGDKSGAQGEVAPSEDSSDELMGYVYVALTTKYLNRELLKLWLFSSILALVIFGLGIGLAYWLGVQIVRPIKDLAINVRRIASGDFNIAIAATTTDEVGRLVSDVEKMRKSIKDLTENLEGLVKERTKELQAAMEELTATNEELTRTRDALWGEMQLAKKIQQVLLPSKPLLEGYDVAVFLKPTDEVGGDYYDVITVEGAEWIVIGDVSGHGVTAGLVMMMVQTAIHTVLSRYPDMTPTDLLTTVNKTIAKNIERLGESKYMTITVIASRKQGKFFFAGLHQDIMIYRAKTKSVDLVETRGMWLGIESDISNMNCDDEFSIEQGDCVLLYTDGVVEATDKKGDMFGDARLVEKFKRVGSKGVNDIKNGILDSLEEYTQHDDIALVVFKRK
ncbi:MAG: SpoIIE family protein phosphatase [Spirochaetes bacterium]|nr:SpoIIE family protein phosphatase [Spirochaetota bacterium]